jgi:hypothetical protein
LVQLRQAASGHDIDLLAGQPVGESGIVGGLAGGEDVIDLRQDSLGLLDVTESRVGPCHTFEEQGVRCGCGTGSRSLVGGGGEENGDARVTGVGDLIRQGGQEVGGERLVLSGVSCGHPA